MRAIKYKKYKWYEDLRRKYSPFIVGRIRKLYLKGLRKIDISRKLKVPYHVVRWWLLTEEDMERVYRPYWRRINKKHYKRRRAYTVKSQLRKREGWPGYRIWRRDYFKRYMQKKENREKYQAYQKEYQRKYRKKGY